MFTPSRLRAATLLAALFATAQLAHAQGLNQTVEKKGSLIGSTLQGSDEPRNIQPGWEHLEGMPAPKTKAKVSNYVVDHYQKKNQEHLYLLLQKVSAKGAKAATWKVLDSLYVKPLDKGKTVEFCATCRTGKRLSNEVYITVLNKPTKQDKQNGYYAASQIWLADRTAGKFTDATATGVKSYLSDGKQ